MEYHLKAYPNYEHTLARKPVKIWVYLEKNSSWRKIYQWKVSPIRIGKILIVFNFWTRKSYFWRKNYLIMECFTVHFCSICTGVPVKHWGNYFNILQWDAPSRWLFHPNSARGSIKTMTTGKTHSALYLKLSEINKIL